MTLRWRGYAASAVGYFSLGALMDFLIVLYYLAVSSRRLLTAVVLSFIVTAVPFLVAEAGISGKRRSLFFWYAAGAGVGTALGLIVHIQ
jgi:hypothetical protein